MKKEEINGENGASHHRTILKDQGRIMETDNILEN